MTLFYNGYKLEAVRNGPWKLALSPQTQGMGLKGLADDAAQPGPRLYHLDTDIGERTNVAANHPERVNRLQALAAEMAADIGNGKPGPGVRPAGLVENPTTLYPTGNPQPSAPAKVNK